VRLVGHAQVQHDIEGRRKGDFEAFLSVVHSRVAVAENSQYYALIGSPTFHLRLLLRIYSMCYAPIGVAVRLTRSHKRREPPTQTPQSLSSEKAHIIVSQSNRTTNRNMKYRGYYMEAILFTRYTQQKPTNLPYSSSQPSNRAPGAIGVTQSIASRRS